MIQSCVDLDARPSPWLVLVTPAGILVRLPLVAEEIWAETLHSACLISSLPRSHRQFLPG